MGKYLKNKETVERFYSEGNEIIQSEYLAFFSSNLLNEKDWKLLQLIFIAKNHAAPASSLVEPMGYKGHVAVNNHFAKIAKAVTNFTSKNPYNDWWFTLLASGENVNGLFYWKLRNELVGAIKIYLGTKSETNQPYDWKSKIKNWVSKTKSIAHYENEMIAFFEQIFKHTFYPERAFFGTNKNTINVVIGHLYLGVYIHSGQDKTFFMIVSKEFTNLNGINCSPVKSTLAKTSKHKLYWLRIENIAAMINILDNEDVWQSFRLASQLVIETPQGKHTRDREKKGKIRLDELLLPLVQISEIEHLQALEQKIEEAKKYDSKTLEKKLLDSPAYPQKVTKTSLGFNRNEYVIIATLNRANGVCELCDDKAPFIRAKNGTPFLEIHHVIPLSENGKDTVDNTVALCPNCHREAHLGIASTEIRNQFLKKLNP